MNGLGKVRRFFGSAAVRQPNGVGAAQTTKISRRAPRAGDEESHRAARRRRDHVLIGAAPGDEDTEQGC